MSDEICLKVITSDDFFTKTEDKIIKNERFGKVIKKLINVEIKSELSFSKHLENTVAKLWFFGETNISRPNIPTSFINLRKKEADTYRQRKGKCCICAYNIRENVDSIGLAKLPTRLISVDKWRVFNTANLCNNCIESASNYLTISYVCGSGTCKSNQYIRNTAENLISHNGSRMKRILEIIKKTESGKYLWMDIFCIDQSNVVTKGTEIARIAQYYAWSHSTIVFLDADLSLSGLALTKEDYYVKTLDFLTMKNKLLMVAGLLDNLVCNEWFTRVWTLQEWILARKITICVIDSEQKDAHCAFLSYEFFKALLTFDDEVLFTCLTEEEKYNILKLCNNDGQSKFIKYAQNMCDFRQRNAYLSASSALELTSRRFCKYEQDKIMGIIGLTGISTIRSYPSSLAEAMKIFIQGSLSIGDYSLIIGPYSTNHDLGWRCLIPVDIEEIRFAGRTHRVLGQPGSVIEGIGIKLNLIDTNYTVVQYIEMGNFMRMKRIKITKWQSIKDVLDLQTSGIFYTDSKDIIGARLFVVRPDGKNGECTFGLLLHQIEEDRWHCVGKSNDLKVNINKSSSTGFEVLPNTSIIIGH